MTFHFECTIYENLLMLLRAGSSRSEHPKVLTYMISTDHVHVIKKTSEEIRCVFDDI